MSDQNIYIMALTIYGITVTNFFFENKHKKNWFFKLIFLLDNTSIKDKLDILFFYSLI